MQKGILENSDLCYESAQGQNSSMIRSRWYPMKVRLWTWNSKQETRHSLADCFSNHSQSFILVLFMNTQEDFHLSHPFTKHHTILNMFMSLCINYVYNIWKHKKLLSNSCYINNRMKRNSNSSLFSILNFKKVNNYWAAEVTIPSNY